MQVYMDHKAEINARKLDEALEFFHRAAEYQRSYLVRDRSATLRLLEQGLEILDAVSLNLHTDF